MFSPLTYHELSVVYEEDMRVENETHTSPEEMNSL